VTEEYFSASRMAIQWILRLMTSGESDTVTESGGKNTRSDAILRTVSTGACCSDLFEVYLPGSCRKSRLRWLIWNLESVPKDCL